MNKIKLLGLAICLSNAVLAGNADRAGEAGASQLLINPWSRSSGWAGANASSCRGLEAQYLNVAGTAFTRKTEVLFSNSFWLAGTQIHSFGFSQGVGETGAIGFSIMSMDFGDIPITTNDAPEGKIGSYSPQFINLGVSYAKGFSDNIFGGFNLKIVSESISNIKSRGVALDAGIQYVTGATDNIKFGISLKNIGPKMQYTGDGLSFRGTAPGAGPAITVEQRSAAFELPSLLNIGGAYDFYLANDTAGVKLHRLTVAGNFTSNSFNNDIFTLGMEYGFKSMFFARAGYNFEKGALETATRVNAFSGPCAGFSVEVPFGKSKSTFAIDYSYRNAYSFKGVNSIGIRINL